MTGHHSQARGGIVGMSVQSQESELMILVGPLQPRISYDSHSHLSTFLHRQLGTGAQWLWLLGVNGKDSSGTPAQAGREPLSPWAAAAAHKPLNPYFVLRTKAINKVLIKKQPPSKKHS